MRNEKDHIFDNPRNVKRILHALYGCCAFLFVLDFVIHRHVYHSWENLWGFYAIYGFVGCVILVLVAKWLRTFIMRPENYYDDEGRVDPAQASAEAADVKGNAGAGGHDVDA
jgi:hypothetical protein